MQEKCDKCDNPATIHLTEIVGGKKIEKHLCEQCAMDEGITIKSNVPISQLLEDFVLQNTEESSAPQPACEVCGMTFAEFRQDGQLGCPNDYELFSEQLDPMLLRAQNGETRHVGKVPRRAGQAQKKQTELLRLRGELKHAVAGEMYERAAELRDRIKKLEAAQ